MRTAAAVNGSEPATAAMNGGQERKRKKPDFSMEWKDLKIEIKVYGKVFYFFISLQTNIFSYHPIELYGIGHEYICNKLHSLDGVGNNSLV